jgi:AcrR family transcriptional regulator
MKNNDRKMQIIKAADKRFARHGFHKTNMDEIARDIRIGKPTLYYYFESKDALYIEVIKWEFENYLDSISKIFSDENITVQKRFEDYFIKKDSFLKLLFCTFLKEQQMQKLSYSKSIFLKKKKLLRKYLQTFTKIKSKLSVNHFPTRLFY